jgi:hypothetical protein
MSLGPEPVEVEATALIPRARPWYAKILSFCFVIFCFEIGVFLLVFPWLEYWQNNIAATYASWLEDMWGNPYFRGALSGLGLVNIYISFLEALRLIRGRR